MEQNIDLRVYLSGFAGKKLLAYRFNKKNFYSLENNYLSRKLSRNTDFKY